MLNSIILHACRADIFRRLLSPTAFDDSPSGQLASSTASTGMATSSNPGIPVIIANEALAGSVAPSVICRERIPSALPETSPSKMLFKQLEQIPARLLNN